MSKSEPGNDNFYSKILVTTIVVIWVSLLGGNWLGHYAVEKGLLGKNQKSEYRSMPGQKPKPWVTVDPRQLEAVENLTNKKNSVPVNLPEASETPKDLVTSTPIAQESKAPAASPTPQRSNGDSPGSISPTPIGQSSPTSGEPPTPTPALGDAKFQLQFGIFQTSENAQRMVEELQRVGQNAKVEEIEAGNGKVYRVRGGAYSEEEARLQRDKLRDQNIEVYIVNKS